MAGCPVCGRGTRNLALAHAIIDDGREHRGIAAAAGISATWFGAVLAGSVKPSASVRARIALALNRDESDLFPEQVPA
jgi:hypothetical protein